MNKRQKQMRFIFTDLMYKILFVSNQLDVKLDHLLNEILVTDVNKMRSIHISPFGPTAKRKVKVRFQDFNKFDFPMCIRKTFYGDNPELIKEISKFLNV